jgi:hypothetical protein
MTVKELKDFLQCQPDRAIVTYREHPLRCKEIKKEDLICMIRVNLPYKKGEKNNGIPNKSR